MSLGIKLFLIFVLVIYVFSISFLHNDYKNYKQYIKGRNYRKEFGKFDISDYWSGKKTCIKEKEFLKEVNNQKISKIKKIKISNYEKDINLIVPQKGVF